MGAPPWRITLKGALRKIIFFKVHMVRHPVRALTSIKYEPGFTSCNGNEPVKIELGSLAVFILRTTRAVVGLPSMASTNVNVNDFPLGMR